MAKPQRNNAIDLFRLVASVMVVMIHTGFLADVDAAPRFVAEDIFPRIAVPFFFCVAGYYYIQALQSGENVFWKTFKSYLCGYVVWSAVYLAYGFAKCLRAGDSVGAFWKEAVLRFFLYGTEGQLWFFPALFVCLIVTTVFHRLRLLSALRILCAALFALRLLCNAYYEIGKRVPGIPALVESVHFSLFNMVVMIGLIFFVFGSVFLRPGRPLSNKALLGLYAACLACFVAEILLIRRFALGGSVTVTFCLPFLLWSVMRLLLQNPMPACGKAAWYCKQISAFVYFSHIAFYTAFHRAFAHTAYPQTLNCLATTAAAIAVGYAIARVDNRWLNLLLGKLPVRRG